MKTIVRLLLGSAVLFCLVFLVSFYLVLIPLHSKPADKDIFGFGKMVEAVETPRKLIRYYEARDGRHLAYRFYDSKSKKKLIFVHGSSYHGASYHHLAAKLSSAGIAKVYLPNLRGHYMSGTRRGDIDYIGQLEDDLADLIKFINALDDASEVYLGGHSSGGGLAIRFAGGEHGALVDGYVLLAPVLPLAPSMRNGDAGGWANLNTPRMYGLLLLNALGIHGLNALPIIEFSKPVAFRDGTETLTYSYRLNTSYHPRYSYKRDIKAMDDKVLVLIGEQDEAVDGAELEKIISGQLPASNVKILPGVNHFGVYTATASIDEISRFLK